MEPLEYPQQLQNLLAGYVLGDLTPEEAATVKQLLENDPNLLAELHRLQSTLAVLSLSLPVSSPNQQLESRILQAAQAEGSPSRQISRVGIRYWRWLAVGSAAALIAGLGIETYQLHQKLATTQLDNHRLHQQLKTAQATLDQIRQTEVATARQELSRYQEAVNLLRQPNNRFLALRGINSELRSSGSLVIVPTKDSAILALQDVASLPEGEVYRMWAFVDGEKISCTDFKPNGKGEVFLQLPLNQWGGTTEVVVTVEPDRAMSKPVGKMVITGS
jgi:anti-sigma-K factor RskA